MRRILGTMLVIPLLLAACKGPEAPVGSQSSNEIIAVNQTALAHEDRVLDLEGGVNFRDLGGYRTVDGQQVKWRTVYRSGSPESLTEADVEKLGSLGIRTVCDFRSNEERAEGPNPFVAANSDVEYLTRDFADGTSGLMGVLGGEDASPEKSRAAMIQFYRTIAQDHAESYRNMFSALAAGKTPLAFNCTAGKDRAGTGAALLLTALGVPRETVIADYALSDQLVDYRERLVEDSGEGSSFSALSKVPYELVEPLLRSDPAYLEAAFASLEEQFGSVDAFIEEELGVTPEMKAAIRGELLTSV